MNIRSNNLGYLFIAPALLFIIIFMLYPVFIGITYSFLDMDLTQGIEDFQFIKFGNFLKLFQDEIFLISVKNSLIFVTTSVLFHFIIGFILALMLDKDLVGNIVFRTINIIPWAISGVCAGLLWIWLYHPQLGALNIYLQKLGLIQEPKAFLDNTNTALIAVLIAHNWRSFPFAFIILLAGLQSIPVQYYEAADLDGANGRQKFLRITVPQMKSVIMTVILLDFLWTFIYFDLPYAMTRGGPINSTHLMTTYVYELSFGFFYFGRGAALAVLVFAINFAFSLFYIVNSTKSEV